MASAPPTPAAKQASVARRMLFHGSRRVSIVQELTACCHWPPASAGDPALLGDPWPRCRRAARSLAMVANWSAVAAKRNSSWPNAASAGSPAARIARRYSSAGGEGAAKFLGVGAARLVVRQRVDDDRVQAGEVRRATAGQVGGGGRRRRSAPDPVRVRDAERIGAQAARRAAAGPAVRRAGPRQHAVVGHGPRDTVRAPGGTPRPAATSRNTSAASANCSARVEDDRGQVEVDLRQHVRQGVDRDPAVAQAQPERADAALEVLHDVLAGHRRVGMLVTLPDIPAAAVAGRPAPAHERRLPRVARDGPAAIGDVERLDLDAVRGDGRELPFRGVDVAVDAEHLGHQPLPLLPGDSGEFGRQHQVVGLARGHAGHPRDTIARIGWL